VQLPEISIISEGPVVFTGAASLFSDSSCPLWIADNGLRFILIQDRRLGNEDFDAIIQPGARSRLLLSGRTDLGSVCDADASYAEVTSILEFNEINPQEEKIAKLREDVRQIVDETQRLLGERSDDLNRRLRDFIDESEARLEEKKNQIRNTVDDLYETISGQLEDRETTRDRINLFAAESNRRIDDLIGRLEEARDLLADDIRDRIDEFVNRLRDSLDGPLVDLITRLLEFEIKADELGARLRELAEQVRMDLEAVLDQKRQAIRMRIEERRAEIESAIEELLDRLRNEITTELADPDDDIPSILDLIQSDYVELLPKLGAGGEDLAGGLSDELRDFLDLSLAELIAKVTEAFDLNVLPFELPETVDVMEASMEDGE
jgi:ElaB/YqjD/DUF883 family membrane-anchored ribosome-binding protein